jgi:hypothetical protein
MMMNIATASEISSPANCFFIEVLAFGSFYVAGGMQSHITISRQVRRTNRGGLLLDDEDGALPESGALAGGIEDGDLALVLCGGEGSQSNVEAEGHDAEACGGLRCDGYGGCFEG